MANDKPSNDLHRFGLTQWEGPVGFPPLSSRVQFEFGAESRSGTRHAVNEDHYIVTRLGRSQDILKTSLPSDALVEHFEEYGFGMVVADGMNDTGDGEAASRLAIATLSHLVLHFGKWNLRVDDRIAHEVMARAERFYRYVDSTVVFESRAGQGPRLRTTLTAAYAAGENLFIAHVGHSRAYLCRDGALMRLTRDHTIGRRGYSTTSVAPLVDVNATAQDLKHILTDTIGMGGSLGPVIDIEHVRIANGDRVLLCTNGLTDMVEESVIATVLASADVPDVQCRTLVGLAISAGGDDDVTALEALFRIPA